MSIRLIFFIVIQLTALVYFFEVLRRIRKRVREYDLTDTEETLPFGIVRLRHLVILYVLVYAIWLLASVMLYVYFIDPAGMSIPDTDSVPSSGSRDVILDL